MAWDRDRIASEIRRVATLGRVDKLRLRHITRAVSTADPREAFEGLAAIFADPKAPDGNVLEQEYAGAILLSVVPPCGKPSEAVTRLLTSWNLSIEQVPLYLEKALGRETLVRVLDVASLTALSGRTVATAKWWLQVAGGKNDA